MAIKMYLPLQALIWSVYFHYSLSPNMFSLYQWNEQYLRAFRGIHGLHCTETFQMCKENEGSRGLEQCFSERCCQSLGTLEQSLLESKKHYISRIVKQNRRSNDRIPASVWPFYHYKYVHNSKIRKKALFLAIIALKVTKETFTIRSFQDENKGM